MIISEENRSIIIETDAENGQGTLYLDRLVPDDVSPEKLRTYAKAVLEPDASVGYHIHTGESESYFILSGIGEYNDDGEIYTVGQGDITITPNGHGHGIKNIGKDNLEFMALIIRD